MKKYLYISIVLLGSICIAVQPPKSVEATPLPHSAPLYFQAASETSEPSVFEDDTVQAKLDSVAHNIRMIRKYNDSINHNGRIIVFQKKAIEALKTDM